MGSSGLRVTLETARIAGKVSKNKSMTDTKAPLEEKKGNLGFEIISIPANLHLHLNLLRHMDNAEVSPTT